MGSKVQAILVEKSYEGMARQSKMWRRLASWLAFALALLVYCLTLEPGASYWDCPEYVVTAWRLEPGHPPGNPLWTLTARMFTILGVTAENAAVAVNLSSALFMAGGVGILASTLFYTLRLTLLRRRNLLNLRLTALFSLCGALCFGWADSPWYSAVEAEVYAMSLFLTALSVRLMIVWALMRDRLKARRYLLLVVYLTGLSLGVHQVHLLVLPVLVLIWYFRRNARRTAWRTALWLLISFGFVGAILLVMMPGVMWLCGECEWLCVNHLHMPYHSGVIICMALLSVISLSLPIAFRGTRLQTRSWVPVLLLTGYSVFFILLIRGAANPPMNEGAPSDIYSLASYLDRDQYGKVPLFYGRTPYSRPLRIEAIDSLGNPSYNRYATRKLKDRIARTTSEEGYPCYVKYGERIEYIYPPELNMVLPRLVSSNPDDMAAYGDWAGMTPETMESVEVSYALDSLGNAVGKLQPDGTRVKERAYRPTYLQQLQYLTCYQIGYMYLRYLLWNFSGRQNDRFAVGEVEHGNFLTGFAPIDDAMLGPQSLMPEEIGHGNAGHNVYFMIPLLLGIAGIFCLSGGKGRDGRIKSRVNFLIFILFFMTGLAIVLYINQSPREPRERDYSYLGSLWAYALWIGAGMAGMWSGSRRIHRRLWRKIAGWSTIVIAVATPLWMLYQNYDDHDRNGRKAVEAYAGNLLRSLEQDAIIFVNGDNHTFPLWYMQEVMGVRRDVTVINMAYLTTPWYQIQMMRPGEQSRPVATQARPEDIAYGAFSHVYFRQPVAVDTLKAKDGVRALKEMYGAGAKYPSLPAVMKITSAAGDSILVAASAVSGGKGSIDAASLMMLDIVATNASSAHPRPIYWHDLLPQSSYAGMYPYTVREMQTRKFAFHPDTLNDMLQASGFVMESGGADRKGFYADATTGTMISRQRMGMVRMAARLLRAGEAEAALRLARESQRLFPPEVWEYQIIYDSDSTHHEGFELSEVILRAGRELGDTAAVKEGERLRDREAARYAEWYRYREALPKRLRNVMTSKNLRKARYGR